MPTMTQPKTKRRDSVEIADLKDADEMLFAASALARVEWVQALRTMAALLADPDSAAAGRSQHEPARYLNHIIFL